MLYSQSLSKVRPKMIRPKIKRIAITGFRSFGSVQQIAEPSETVSVFWGGNSNGKTSFGEAIEFLLTGQIARRELLAGAKDEFAASLRNAHIDDNSVVAVDALLVDAEGTEHTVRRELIHDYQRGSAAGCTSRLKIDSKVASETELQTVLGLRLFPPPLQAPVLSQNTLGFLFSSSPADRAAYFRSSVGNSRPRGIPPGDFSLGRVARKAFRQRSTQCR